MSSRPSSTEEDSSLDEIIEPPRKQMTPGYSDLFRDWKLAQGEIKSTLQTSHHEQREASYTHRPRDSLAVIRGNSTASQRAQQEQYVDEEEPPSSPRRKSRIMSAEERIQRAYTEAARGDPATILAEQHPSSTSRDRKQQRQTCTILVLLVIAIVSTLAVALSPLLFLRGANNHSGNNSATSSSTTTTGNTIPPPPPLDPRDPAGDVVVAVSPSAPYPPLVPVLSAPTLRPTRDFFTARPTQVPATGTTSSSNGRTTNDGHLEAMWDQVRSFVTVSDLHFQDTASPYAKAWTFVAYVDLLAGSSTETTTPQRFTMALLNAAVGGAFADPLVHECAWGGVECDEKAAVTTIAWSNYGLRGHLPKDIGLLSTLTSLDLADNQLWGTLPESLYTGLPGLEYLYLHQNHLSGTLSNNIAQLSQLQRLYLASNFLSGTIPRALGSPTTGGQHVRVLEYLSLYDNHFTGTIPPDLNLRNLFYLDLGKNRFSGTFPEDWVEGRDNLRRLRLLYLDHNDLIGSLPPNLGTIGGGRLQLLSVQSNQLTGMIPGFHNHSSFLNVAEYNDNQFTTMDQQGLCRQIVFNGGELVMLRADCQACLCNYFCQAPVCY